MDGGHTRTHSLTRTHTHTQPDPHTHTQPDPHTLSQPDPHTHTQPDPHTAHPCTDPDPRVPRTLRSLCSQPAPRTPRPLALPGVCTPARTVFAHPLAPRPLTHPHPCHAVPIPRSRPARLSAPPGASSGSAERAPLSPGMGVRGAAADDNRAAAAQPPRAGQGCTERGSESCRFTPRVRRGGDGLHAGHRLCLLGAPRAALSPRPRVSAGEG